MLFRHAKDDILELIHSSFIVIFILVFITIGYNAGHLSDFEYSLLNLLTMILQLINCLEVFRIEKEQTKLDHTFSEVDFICER